jgi:hypothetical protein
MLVSHMFPYIKAISLSYCLQNLLQVIDLMEGLCARWEVEELKNLFCSHSFGNQNVLAYCK